MNSQEAKCLQSGTPDLSDFHINPFFRKFREKFPLHPNLEELISDFTSKQIKTIYDKEERSHSMF